MFSFKDWTNINTKVEETVLHNRYERAHGKKASSREVASWVFTTKEMGDVNYNNPKQVYFAKGQQKLGAAGKEAMKALKTKYVYVMESVQEAISKPHVFVGIKDMDPTSNLRPNNKMKGDLILVKPVESDFFENNLKDNIKDPYEFLQELGIHIGFGILIRDKVNEKKLVDAIAKKKSFSAPGYHDDKVYAVDTNENKLRKTLESSKINEAVVTELQENKVIEIRGMWSAEVSNDDECKLSYDKPNKDLVKKLAMNWLITGGFDTNEDPKKWARNGFNFDGHPEFPDLPEYLDIDYLNNGEIVIEKITRNWKKAAKELDMLGIDSKKNINWNGKNPTKKADWKLSQKEEVEINEMNWTVGGVYHQEFKNGDKIYFRADSVQKNKRWKGMSVDEFGGRQKKAKNASADEKQQGWVATPKNEIPKGLKEEIGIREGKIPRGIRLTPELFKNVNEISLEGIVDDIDDDAKKVKFKWKKMDKLAKKKWMDGILAKAKKEGMTKAEVMSVLAPYRLKAEEVEIEEASISGQNTEYVKAHDKAMDLTKKASRTKKLDHIVDAIKAHKKAISLTKSNSNKTAHDGHIMDLSKKIIMADEQRLSFKEFIVDTPESQYSEGTSLPRPRATPKPRPSRYKVNKSPDAVKKRVAMFRSISKTREKKNEEVFNEKE